LNTYTNLTPLSEKIPLDLVKFPLVLPSPNHFVGLELKLLFRNVIFLKRRRLPNSANLEFLEFETQIQLKMQKD